MVMAPWELASAFTVREFSVSVNAGGLAVLAENTSRVGIIFSYNTGTGPGFVSTIGTAIGTRGLRITSTANQPIKLTFDCDGPLVHKKWFLMSAADITITIFETCLIRNPCNGDSGGNVQVFNPATGLPYGPILP